MQTELIIVFFTIAKSAVIWPCKRHQIILKQQVCLSKASQWSIKMCIVCLQTPSRMQPYSRGVLTPAKTTEPEGLCAAFVYRIGAAQPKHCAHLLGSLRAHQHCAILHRGEHCTPPKGTVARWDGRQHPINYGLMQSQICKLSEKVWSTSSRGISGFYLHEYWILSVVASHRV